MDSNFGQIQGMDLSQSSGGQGASAGSSGAGGSIGQGTMAGGPPQPQVGLPVQTADEAVSDDELDQEWINRAKDVVERTKSDPYAQSSELNKIKAEYLKARFNKELNVGNGTSQ